MSGFKKVAVASHVALINDRKYDGIGNALKDILPEVTNEFVFVRHSMEGGLHSEVQYFKGNELVCSVPLPVARGISVLRYITEVFATIRYFKKHPVDTFIGIDPLNALAGVLLKKNGSVKRAIFYTPDYSPARFSSKVLNWLYHRIDSYCVDKADEVWSVSPLIAQVRRDMGLVEEKNKVLPNVPPEKYNFLRENKHDKHTLFTCGIIDKQLDFEGAIGAIELLRPEYPDLKLVVVGNGPEEKRLKGIVADKKLSDKIIFMGRLNLADTLEQTSKAGIGLALYTGVWGFNAFGDSTKCREYANFGLPIITTNTHATVPDIEQYHAGLVVEKNVDSYADAIKKILDNYESYSRSSARLGAAYSGAHRKILARVLA